MGKGTSILTNGQRDYLNGDAEPSQERTVKTRIRQRLRDAPSDFSLILDELGVDEIETAFNDEPARASDLVALAVLAEEFSPKYGTGVSGQEPAEQPESTIIVGVRRAYEKLGVSLETVDVAIEQGAPLDELEGEDLTTLSDDELGQLFSSGRITRKQMSDALIEKDVQFARDDVDEE